MPTQYISDAKALQLAQEEVDTLHAENALKLTQILDLEQLLYDLRLLDLEDNSPCWCCNWLDDESNEAIFHTEDCIKARQATEPFWKKAGSNDKSES